MVSTVSFAFLTVLSASSRPGPPPMAAAWGPPPAPPPTVPADTAAAGTQDVAALQEKVKALFDDQCTMCHSGGDPADPGSLDLGGDLAKLAGKKSVVTDKLLVAPGDPKGSYLLDKMTNAPGMKGDLMPQGMDPLTKEQLQVVTDWITALPPDAGKTTNGGTPPNGDDGDGPEPVKPPGRKPFNGTEQNVLPTTSTLGKRTLQYRIDHRFGRIGTERGFFGLDAGVVMSMGLAYGIFDGWDVRLRRTNSRKGWELGTKYVPVRQEAGMPLSFGMWAAVDFYRDFDVANPWAGDFMAMISRRWFDRWATMLTFSYHLPTNRNTRVLVDRPDDGQGARPVKDTRGTFVFGFATSVYLGKRKQWGIDLEWLLPLPDGAKPYNKFYYRGGDADPAGTKIGAWSIGGSYTTGKHFFQVFFTNNREIHLNLAAPGGQTKNPFSTPGVDSKNPFHKFNFFLGFNLGRNFTMGTRIDRAKEKRKKKKAAKGGAA